MEPVSAPPTAPKRKRRWLTHEEVREIRIAIASGEPQKAIAYRLGWARSTICRVAKGQRHGRVDAVL